MTVEIGSVFNDICNKSYSISGLNVIFSSILNTSIILCIIVLLIITFIYPCKKGTSSLLLLKLFIYIFISVVFILSIHSSIIKNNYQEKSNNTKLNSFMNNIDSNQTVYGGDMIKPSINLQTEQNFEISTEENVVKNESVTELLDKLNSEI